MQIIYIFIFLFINTLTFAARYYVSNTGSDYNDGLTEGTPWKTITRVNSQSLYPGDSVLFKRGDIWVRERINFGFSGTENNPITYTAYGDLNKPRPVITGIDQLPGWNNPKNWTETSSGSNSWTMRIRGSWARRLWINDEEVPRSRSDVEGDVSEEYPWMLTFNTDLYVYSIGNPAKVYKSIMATSSARFPGDVALTDHIVLSHLDINGWRDGRLYGCSYWVIEHCNLGWGNSEYGLRVSRHPDTQRISENGILRYCIIDSGDRFPETRNPSVHMYKYNTHAGVALGSGCKNWHVHDNEFYAWGHGNFGIVSVAGVSEGNKHYNNYHSQQWGDYGRAFGVGGVNLEDFCEDNPNEIFNNYIYQQGVQSQINAPYTKVYNNVFNGVRGIGNDPGQYANAVAIEAFSGRIPFRQKFYNNVFAYSGTNGVFFPAYSQYTHPVEGNEFINNIFYENGRHFWASNTDKVKNCSFKNNIFYTSQNDNFRIYDSFMSLDDFNDLTEDTENNRQNYITEGNIGADPLFVDPENGDFRLQKNSPAIRMGIVSLNQRHPEGVRGK